MFRVSCWRLLWFRFGANAMVLMMCVTIFTGSVFVHATPNNIMQISTMVVEHPPFWCTTMRSILFFSTDNNSKYNVILCVSGDRRTNGSGQCDGPSAMLRKRQYRCHHDKNNIWNVKSTKLLDGNETNRNYLFVLLLAQIDCALVYSYFSFLRNLASLISVAIRVTLLACIAQR